MYERYWQLEFNPFDNDADPRAFFRSETHQAALLKLRYLIEQRKGVGVLAGETGCGKSYLLRHLVRQLGEPFGPCIHLVYPQMAAAELLAYLAVELGADPLSVGNERGGLDRTVREIDRLLSSLAERDLHPVIVVDEAHLIDDVQVFQALRLMLNFQRNLHHQFSLILAGQRELLGNIRRVVQLDERIAARSLLRALSPDETADYVANRLNAAGARRNVFAPDAFASLHELSGGVPRRINRLCDLALLVGYADELEIIASPQIESVAEEMTCVPAQ